MTSGFCLDEWKIIEHGLHPETNRVSESIFTLANEHMGLRGFFEEKYSGNSLKGTYIGGVYYPDKTRVGWWKIGYPEFFAKVPNSTNWVGIGITVNGREVDLARGSHRDFRRVLDMKTGTLTRSFVWIDCDGIEVRFTFTRFLSMSDRNIACVKVEAEPLNGNAELSFTPYLNGDVVNEDANYGEKFWDEVNRVVTDSCAVLTMKTKKTGFLVSTAMAIGLTRNGNQRHLPAEAISREKYAAYRVDLSARQNESISVEKYIAVCTSRQFPEDKLEAVARDKAIESKEKGYTRLFAEHSLEMSRKWEEYDVVIEGDVKAQQGVRYCIFQLTQHYLGWDPRLNIGPKGFSGEKYGGVVYWDTEAFCLPFYLYTNEDVARNLLFFRYRHLDKARENARKLGLNGALYPMVTIDGRECHNEWEITFEEIHRNAAIAYAIYNYTNYTGDSSYLHSYGIEVLIEISRFWADRVTYNARKDKYMILGVTGPNEYENNVNNNWYTNTMAAWTLEYTLQTLNELNRADSGRYQGLLDKMSLGKPEMEHWQDIIDKMYYPYVEELGIFEQNDLYMDKEQVLVKNIPAGELPLNKHWSWDRILRSCFIKQADVLQAIYFLTDRFDLDTARRNFDFYEPRTVHESSLSPSVHSIIASRIGYRDKAYELYLRTSRLDLENYNRDTDDGIHLTSMAGSWSAIVEGFAGLRAKDGVLYLAPYLPGPWKGYSFKFRFRRRKLLVVVHNKFTEVRLLSGDPLTIVIHGREYRLDTKEMIKAALNP